MDDTVVTLLRAILQELSILSAPVKSRAETLFREEFLTTDARHKIWGVIENSTSADIATAASCSERAVQLFVAELVEAGLVKVVQNRPRLVEKDPSRVALYFLAKGRLS